MCARALIYRYYVTGEESPALLALWLQKDYLVGDTEKEKKPLTFGVRGMLIMSGAPRKNTYLNLSWIRMVCFPFVIDFNFKWSTCVFDTRTTGKPMKGRALVSITLHRSETSTLSIYYVILPRATVYYPTPTPTATSCSARIPSRDSPSAVNFVSLEGGWAVVSLPRNRCGWTCQWNKSLHVPFQCNCLGPVEGWISNATRVDISLGSG